MSGFYSDGDIEFKTHKQLNVEGFAEREVHRKRQNGVEWTVKFFKRDNATFLKWKFEWTTREIEGYRGELKYDVEVHDERTVELNVTASGEWIEKKVEDLAEFYEEEDYCLYLDYQLKLTPVLSEDALLEASFSTPSQFTDIVLLVEEKKLHTNKMFLMAHSEYFRELFSHQLPEKWEFTIVDVKFLDFSRLLSILLPKPYRPPERSAEPLLMLADRFMMPKATEQVELRLLAGSNIKPAKLLLLSQKYCLGSLLEYMLKKFESRAQLKTLRGAPENDELSPDVKALLYSRLLKFI